MPNSGDDRSRSFKNFFNKLARKVKKQDKSDDDRPKGFKYRTTMRNITPEERAAAPNLGESGWGRDSWPKMKRRQELSQRLTPATAPVGIRGNASSSDTQTKNRAQQNSHLSMIAGPPTPAARRDALEQGRRAGAHENMRDWGDQRQRAEALLEHSARKVSLTKQWRNEGGA